MNIEEAAALAGIDPATANAEDWQEVLTYVMSKADYHSLRSRPDFIQSVVNKKAGMHGAEGWLFGKWGKMRIGSTGKKGRQRIKQALKPTDISWQAFYKQQAKLVGDYLDVALELDGMLDAGIFWFAEEAERFRACYAR